MYDQKCNVCGGIVPDLSDDLNSWDDIYNEIAKELLSGNSADINTDLYFKTAGYLMEAVGNGLGGSGFAYDDERAVLSNYLQNNIYAFSAAKSLTQMLHYRNLMIGGDGKLLEFGSFRKVIADQGAVFNNAYLKAEYDNAKYSAIMAHKWDNLNSEYLQYSTVGDNRVRPEHAALDKFTALKSDPVWNKIYPPKAWGCRCNVIPGKANAMDQNPMSPIEAAQMMNEHIKETAFDNHVGKSKVIFTEDHPYFQNVKGDIKNLSWEQYGLLPLEKIRVNPLPEYKAMNKAEFDNWWQKQPKKSGDDIIVKDVLKQEVLLSSGEGKGGKKDNFFKDHIFKKTTENRYEYAAETANILKAPDEVWNSKQGRVYLKYYEQGTLKLVANDKLEAVTIYKIFEVDSGELKRSRKGVLLYKK